MSDRARERSLLFRSPGRLPLVAPSILSADFARLGEECAHVLGEGGADLLHLDVMDGHFVPNLTMGPDLCRGLRRALPGAFLDVHLMVERPGEFVKAFVDAGADHLTFHVEAVGFAGVAGLAEEIRRVGGGRVTAGVAINPPTAVEVLCPIEGGAVERGAIDAVDLVLVMSVNPGFSGQRFISEVLEKTRRVRELGGDRLRVQMDGGIGPDNAANIREAGCDVLVAASAVFGLPREDRAGVVGRLRG